MTRVNYKRIMDEEIKKICSEGVKPSLLLHVCCAPCSSAVLEVLKGVFDITVFFYNPNISPEKEFVFRLSELRRLLPEMGLGEISVIAPPYDNKEFEAVVKGLESTPEGGERCKRCYRLRLEKSVSYAKKNSFDYVTTTLSVSPHKNAQWLNEIGIEFGNFYGIKYLCSDFKKGEGYKRSCVLSEQYSLYRQDYCGCIYSKNKGKTIVKYYKYLPDEARQIREEVFIKEQGFKEEYDELDNTAVHVVLFDFGSAIATCRILKGDTAKNFLIGRIAVKKQFRKKGIGSKVVKAAEEYVKRHGGKSIILHSQLQATDFYKKLGFAEFGEIEYEEDCPHIFMKKELYKTSRA